MAVVINTKIKDGWSLNSNERLVNATIKGIAANDGHCLNKHIYHRGSDMCPCDEYLKYNNCICKLYINDSIKSNEE